MPTLRRKTANRAYIDDFGWKENEEDHFLCFPSIYGNLTEFTGIRLVMDQCGPKGRRS
jgi:hypothetical protein